MKKPLPLLITILALAACDKTDKNEAEPTPIAAAFNQEFELGYRQQVRLATAIQPELTVEVTDIQYAICPKNAYCFAANFVAPTLSVTDAQGQVQEVKLPINQDRIYTPAWIDTTSVRANSRRYVFCYTRWNINQQRDQPAKRDITVMLRVTR